MTRYQPLLYQAGSYSAAELRHLLDSVYPAGGVSGMPASVVTGTMNLQIGLGRAVVPVGGVTGMLDNVLCVSDANENVAIAAAPPSGQSRIDIVSVMPNESNLGWTFYVWQGTPAAVPVAPNTAGGGTLPIWQVLVPGGVANLNTATLTDLRTPLVPGGASAWTPLPLLTGWAQVSGFAAPAVRVDGYDLKFRGRLQNTTQAATSGSRYQFATLPALPGLPAGPPNRIFTGSMPQVGSAAVNGKLDIQGTNMGVYVYGAGTGIVVDLDGERFDILP